MLIDQYTETIQHLVIRCMWWNLHACCYLSPCVTHRSINVLIIDMFTLQSIIHVTGSHSNQIKREADANNLSFEFLDINKVQSILQNHSDEVHQIRP